MEFLPLFLFLLQALGVTLGVGASTFAVIFYLLAKVDGDMDVAERRFMHAVFITLRVGLFLIISTGVAITLAHALAGDSATITTPAYLFKWVLVGVLLANGFLLSTRLLPLYIGGAVAGATWYALFIVHTLALAGAWSVFIPLYIVWLALFSGAFALLQRHADRLHAAHVPHVPSPKHQLLPKAPSIDFLLTQATSKDTNSR